MKIIREKLIKIFKQSKKFDFRNLVSLTLIQLSNIISILFLFPYALKELGPELYSRLVTTEAWYYIALCFVLYSFEIDGVGRAAKLYEKNRIDELNSLYTEVICVRTLILALIVVVCFVVCPLIDSQIYTLLGSWAVMLLASAVQPLWIFQAIQKNGNASLIIASCRIVACIVVAFMMLTIKEPHLIPLVLGCFGILAALIQIKLLDVNYKIRFVKVSPIAILKSIDSGMYIFISNLAVVGYRDANVLIMNLAGLDPLFVSIYSISEKIVKGLQALIRPLNQLYFPKAVIELSRYHKPCGGAFKVLAKNLRSQYVVLGFAALFLLFLKSISSLTGMLRLNEINEILYAVNIMVPATLFGASNYMLGVCGLNILNDSRWLLISIILTSSLAIPVSYMLTLNLSFIGTSISFVLAEAILFFLISVRYLRSVR